MKKTDVIRKILTDKSHTPVTKTAREFASANIALIKYWGKRNQELNLPVTNSLSISLGTKGARTRISLSKKNKFVLNQQALSADSTFAKRLSEFLSYFNQQQYLVEIESTVPIAAGLASSACGFAAMAKVLNAFYNWQLSERELSIIARLGSGSASRSIQNGFVEWYQGERDDGMDSFAEALPVIWPELTVGLLILNANEKHLSSRNAMQATIETSGFYRTWPRKVADDLVLLKEAIAAKNFELLGKTAESNSLALHATMWSAWPPISFTLPETLAAMHTVWHLRQSGLQIYFTQDAGPNLKLLFEAKDVAAVQTHFPTIEFVKPFHKENYVS